MTVIVSRRRATAALLALGASARIGAAPLGYEIRQWPAGKPAPLLDAVTLDDQSWSLEAQHGRVVVLNFWATWCEPCVAEMESLDTLSRQGRVVVVGVDYKEATLRIQAFLERHPVSYPVLRDVRGDAFKRWTEGVLPTTFVIDPRGQPRASLLGEMDWTSAPAMRLIEAASAPR